MISFNSSNNNAVSGIGIFGKEGGGGGGGWEG